MYLHIYEYLLHTYEDVHTYSYVSTIVKIGYSKENKVVVYGSVGREERESEGKKDY